MQTKLNMKPRLLPLLLVVSAGALSLNGLAGCVAPVSTSQNSSSEPSTSVPSSPQIDDPSANFIDEYTSAGLKLTKLLDENGTDVGSFELSTIPEGTKALLFSVTCNGRGGYRLFDGSDNPYILMSGCGNKSSIEIPVESFKPPLEIWSTGDYRVVVLASPEAISKK